MMLTYLAAGADQSIHAIVSQFVPDDLIALDTYQENNPWQFCYACSRHVQTTYKPDLSDTLGSKK